jgi:hypothetical protein
MMSVLFKPREREIEALESIEGGPLREFFPLLCSSPTKACACAASFSLCFFMIFVCVVCLSLVLGGGNGSFLGGIGWFYYVGFSLGFTFKVVILWNLYFDWEHLA